MQSILKWKQSAQATIQYNEFEYYTSPMDQFINETFIRVLQTINSQN